MNAKAVYIYLSVKANRQSMINKIEKGFKNKDININKDLEVEEFQKGFLENWKDLEKFPKANEDLIGLSNEEKKAKIKKLKLQFCEWVSGEDAIAEGYKYAFEKKEHIKGQMVGAGRSVASKVKAGVQIITGKKIGRNDLCSCESGIKYKKCCGRNN